MNAVSHNFNFPPEICRMIFDAAGNDADVRQVCGYWHAIIEDKYERLYDSILDSSDEESQRLLEGRVAEFQDNIASSQGVIKRLYDKIFGTTPVKSYVKVWGLRRSWPLKGGNPKDSTEWAARFRHLLNSGSGDVGALGEFVYKNAKQDSWKKDRPVIKTFLDQGGAAGILSLADKLSGLKMLDLRFSAIDELPSAIKFLEGLETFILCGNKLTTLPPEIGSLEKLRILNLSHNRIKDLPLSLLKLVKLIEMRLQGNKELNDLPDELKVMEGWTQLKIQWHYPHQPTQ